MLVPMLLDVQTKLALVRDLVTVPCDASMHVLRNLSRYRSIARAYAPTHACERLFHTLAPATYCSIVKDAKHLNKYNNKISGRGDFKELKVSCLNFAGCNVQ